MNKLVEMLHECRRESVVAFFVSHGRSVKRSRNHHAHIVSFTVKITVLDKVKPGKYPLDADIDTLSSFLSGLVLHCLGFELLVADTELAAPIAQQFAQIADAQTTNLMHANQQ